MRTMIYIIIALFISFCFSLIFLVSHQFAIDSMDSHRTPFWILAIIVIFITSLVNMAGYNSISYPSKDFRYYIDKFSIFMSNVCVFLCLLLSTDGIEYSHYGSIVLKYSSINYILLRVIVSAILAILVFFMSRFATHVVNKKFPKTVQQIGNKETSPQTKETTKKEQ